ncbi:MAG: TIGR00725 family protein [Thermoplasmata archaeon]
MVLNISVIGGSEISSDTCSIAKEVGRLLARGGATVYCGGLSGVMECVAIGVREENGLVIGILPGTKPEEGNRYLSAAIPTGLGYARNFLVARAGKVIIAIDGSTGTISEASFAMTEGKTVISIGSFEITPKKEGEGKFIKATTPKEAVDLAFKIARES